MMDASKCKVETYSVRSNRGGHVRMATRLILPDGQVVPFLDKMSKREAIRQYAMQAASRRECAENRRRLGIDV
jgi:hypothetical protein